MRTALKVCSCSGEGCLSTTISMLCSPEEMIKTTKKFGMKISLILPFVPLPQSNLQTMPTLKTYFNSITQGKYPGCWNQKRLHAIFFLDTQPLKVLQEDPNERIPCLFFVTELKILIFPIHLLEFKILSFYMFECLVP